MTDDVTGLILAGGRSRRFGSDKARAEVGGRPMIARVYEALVPLCAEVLVSVGSETTTYPLPGPARFVADRLPDAGPLGGLEAGLRAAQTPWLLALACDLPFLTTGTLRPLLDARADDADAVVAVTPDGKQPLCTCYHSRVLPVVGEQLAWEQGAMHALLSRLRIVTVPVAAMALRNVNAPDDLRREN